MLQESEDELSKYRLTPLLQTPAFTPEACLKKKGSGAERSLPSNYWKLLQLFVKV